MRGNCSLLTCSPCSYSQKHRADYFSEMLSGVVKCILRNTAMVEPGVMGRVKSGLCNEPQKEKGSQGFISVCPGTRISVFSQCVSALLSD